MKPAAIYIRVIHHTIFAELALLWWRMSNDLIEIEQIWSITKSQEIEKPEVVRVKQI